MCAQSPKWNGKPLSLHLDHINGINNDNRIENLRILCPHCHSQQHTTRANKNNKKDISTKFCDCGEIIRPASKTCRKCAGVNSRKFEVSKEELEVLIKNNSMVKTGKMFNVSDNAVKKRAKKFGIVI